MTCEKTELSSPIPTQAQAKAGQPETTTHSASPLCLLNFDPWQLKIRRRILIHHYKLHTQTAFPIPMEGIARMELEARRFLPQFAGRASVLHLGIRTSGTRGGGVSPSISRVGSDHLPLILHLESDKIKGIGARSLREGESD